MVNRNCKEMIQIISNIINSYLTYAFCKYFIIIIFFVLFFTSNEQFEIQIIIKEAINQNFLSEHFSLEPINVIVNGENREDSCIKSCDFEYSDNNVIIQFNNLIDTCENMFAGITNLVEIDLTYFDTSNIVSMSGMFNGCFNLENIIFGNFNTTSLKTMHRLFYNCNKLTSLDLSKFDTSSVTNMVETFSHCESLSSLDVTKFNTQNVEDMTDLFAYCYKLTSINLYNFNTSKVTKMKGMFYRCEKLNILDLSNFDFSSVINNEYMFDGTNSLLYLNIYSFKIKNKTNDVNILTTFSSELKICIYDLETRELLQFKGYNFSYLKIDLKQNICVEHCNESEFKYEYNNYCLEECPNKTFPIYNKFECLNTIPEGYYFDTNDLFYKKCFDSCKTCFEGSNGINNNCIDCKENYTFINESNYSSNCYENCTFYYYFDGLDKFTCTESDNCPEQFSKRIKNKKNVLINAKMMIFINMNLITLVLKSVQIIHLVTMKIIFA